MFRHHQVGICLPAVMLCLAFLIFPATAESADNKLTVYAEFIDIGEFEVDVTTSLDSANAPARLVLAVLAEAGFEADINVVPWTRLVQSLDTQPNVLGFSMTRTPDREDHYHWIGLIRPISFKLWGLPERAQELPRTLEEARHLRVRALRSDVVASYLLGKGFTNLVYLSDNSNSVRLLRRNRIDLMPYIESGIDDYLAQHNEPPGAVVPLIDLEEISTGHYLVMSKQSDPELVRLLKEAFQSIVDRGDYDRIMQISN